MFRCSSLVIVLSLCVFGQADVLLSTPSKSFPFPTGQSTWEETPAPTTKGSANDVTESYVPNDARFQPAPGRSDSTPVAPTASPTPQPTDSVTSTSPQPTIAATEALSPQPTIAATEALSPQPTIATTEAPSPQPTNATTEAPSPQPTNATTEAPSPQPTNATTEAPSPQPTNATTEAPSPQPTNATTEAPSPQPTNATTEAPSPQPTNATTEAPSPQPTNATTASPPTPTTPSLPKVGDYVVRASPNSSACLMARMGLQFSYRMGDSFQTINLDPNVTKTTGTCGDASNDSALMLVSDKIAVQFVFSNQTSKFFLSALTFTVVTGSGPNFTAVNTNLSLWEASLGSSYMCKKEQSFNITDSFILNTFELQVQPFGVMNDQFSTAHECSVDDTSLLIPIIVGAALAVLILIVVIAYVIGRRKTYVGYQTL